MVIIVYVVVVMIMAINNDGQIEQTAAISTKCRKGNVYSM